MQIITHHIQTNNKTYTNTYQENLQQHIKNKQNVTNATQ